MGSCILIVAYTGAVSAACPGSPSLSSGAAPSVSAPGKTRLRWTPELHEKFITAVAHLGGADRKFTCPLTLFIILNRNILEV